MSYIKLDVTTAEALAATLIAENHGVDSLNAQRPLKVTDYGDSILVKGTPYLDRVRRLSFCASHVTFSRDDAEVLDFGCDGRLTLSSQEEHRWRSLMSEEDFARVFGPRQDFDLEQKSSSMWLFTTANGGLLNTAELVTAYAAILLKLAWQVPSVDAHQLQAFETDGIWEVATTTGGKSSAVLAISRSTGRVCRLVT